MKKYVQKAFLICGYLLMIAVFTDFRIKQLFNLKELFLVAVGAVILTLPYITEKKKKSEFLEIAGNNSMLSSYMVALVLILGKAGEMEPGEAMMQEILLSLRPILYGLTIMLLLKQPEEKRMIDLKPAENPLAEQKLEGVETKQLETEMSEPKIVVTEVIEEKETTENRCYKQGLTARETEIVKLVIGGLSNREIGEQLYIAESTVKKHMSNILEKLEVKNREQLKQMFRQ